MKICKIYVYIIHLCSLSTLWGPAKPYGGSSQKNSILWGIQKQKTPPMVPHRAGWEWGFVPHGFFASSLVDKW